MTQGVWAGDSGPAETFPRQTLAGSGDSYSRCDRHYSAFVERVQPKMEEINRRYPAMAPGAGPLRLPHAFRTGQPRLATDRAR
jgi:hypothetical protein